MLTCYNSAQETVVVSCEFTLLLSGPFPSLTLFYDVVGALQTASGDPFCLGSLCLFLLPKP